MHSIAYYVGFIVIKRKCVLINGVAANLTHLTETNPPLKIN